VACDTGGTQRQGRETLSRMLSLLVAMVVAGATLTSRWDPAISAPSSAAALPAFSHVYLIVMENKEYPAIVGNPDARYINNQLIPQYGLAARYYAVTHPSEPNYLALFSGAVQGVHDDRIHHIDALNLVDLLEPAGHSWAVFAENVPLDCYRLNSASGGPDGPGTYARRHEPAIIFTDIARNPARCAHITNFSHFDASAADFELIIPNLCHDMHDCGVGSGDAFLRRFVPGILDSPDFATSVLFVTFDEGTTASGGGGHVATLVISPLAKAGFRSKVTHSHYSLLRTIEDAWGLECLRRTCNANNLAEFFNQEKS
jgi:hypothetical protein